MGMIWSRESWDVARNGFQDAVTQGVAKANYVKWATLRMIWIKLHVQYNTLIIFKSTLYLCAMDYVHVGEALL